MARTEGVTIVVKVPIMWEAMTKRTKQRLREIVGRDTRAIHAFLGIIERHESILLTGQKRNHIDEGELDKLSLTAIKVTHKYSQRLVVPHDLKARFPRMSASELHECRQTAAAMYESYLKLRSKKRGKALPPTRVGPSKRIPRWQFSPRFKLLHTTSKAVSWWLSIRDSLDSAREGRVRHDKLLVPLRVSPFHENQFKRGDLKALQVVSNSEHKWWIAFAVRVKVPAGPSVDLRPAVLGIDLGIDKATCTALVTPTKVSETRYFLQQSKVQLIKKYDRLVAELQREMYTRQNKGQPSDGIARILRNMRSKREHVAIEYDKLLVRQIIDYITDLSQKYSLYVALGRLKGIRNSARKGSPTSHKFRGMIHRWAFARISDGLRHGLSQRGWPLDRMTSRFRVIPESWTSIMCWKCGSKGIRPKQNYFVCPACGHKTNADRNGAINIAGRLIMLTESLHSVNGVGKWADSASAEKRSRLKARRMCSIGNSSLPTGSVVSHSRKPAAVRYVQTDLLGSGNGTASSDNDPAVAKTVEILSVADDDTTAQKQEKKAGSVGGIPSC